VLGTMADGSHSNILNMNSIDADPIIVGYLPANTHYSASTYYQNEFIFTEGLQPRRSTTEQSC
jgi:hypothetical protein